MERKSSRTLKLPAGLLFLLFCSPAQADLTGRVVAVTDGDTIKVLDSTNTQHKVRLTGIDAPERGQPFGTKSRDHLASMVAGKEVRVESTKNDRYGRVLGKVWVQPSDCPTCGKTLDANHAQVLSGMAWWYRYYAKEQSPEDRGRYESAEHEAKARGWGLIRIRLTRMSGGRRIDNGQQTAGSMGVRGNGRGIAGGHPRRYGHSNRSYGGTP